VRFGTVDTVAYMQAACIDDRIRDMPVQGRGTTIMPSDSLAIPSSQASADGLRRSVHDGRSAQVVPSAGSPSDEHRRDAMMVKLVRSLFLAGVIAAASAGTVAASDHFVEVTDVTFSGAEMCGTATKSACVVITGTMTCAEEGPAELVNMEITQRGLRGTDNLDLLDFACSTEPREFTAIAETFGAGLFRPGRARVTASLSGTVIASDTIRIRPH
jgi:hypothetical protein